MQAELAARQFAPTGVADQRYTFAYIFGAVEPLTDNAFALVLPEANTAAKIRNVNLH